MQIRRYPKFSYRDVVCDARTLIDRRLSRAPIRFVPNGERYFPDVLCVSLMFLNNVHSIVFMDSYPENLEIVPGD